MTKDKKDEKNESIWKDVGWFALKTAGISAAVLGGTALAVPALGFGAGGVAAGSLAAYFQSAVLGGTIASGSAFAVLQSVGAAGLAAGTQAAVVATSALASGVHTAVKKFKRKKAATGEKNDCGASIGNNISRGQSDKLKKYRIFFKKKYRTKIKCLIISKLLKKTIVNKNLLQKVQHMLKSSFPLTYLPTHKEKKIQN